MGKSDERASLILAICMLVVHTPAEAWYKQAAGPSYYSVGRASGLLAGIRRSAIRRDEAGAGDREEGAENSALFQAHSRSFALKTLPICVKDILPELQNCELMGDSTFQCEAAVIITFDSRNCVNE